MADNDQGSVTNDEGQAGEDGANDGEESPTRPNYLDEEAADFSSDVRWFERDPGTSGDKASDDNESAESGDESD